MGLEEAFEGHTCGLPGLVWLSMQQPRSLTDEGREFGSLSRIAPITNERSSGVSTTLRKPAPSRIRLTRAGSLQLNWPGSSGPNAGRRRHKMTDSSDACSCPRILRS